MQLILERSSAVAISLAFSALFVVVLYLVPKRIRALPRDDPEHIKWRMGGTSLAATVSICTVAYFSRPGGKPNVLALLGLPEEGVMLAVASSMGLTMMLFTAPMLQLWASYRVGVPLVSDNLYVLGRNLFYAPLLEEVVFRGCMVPVLLAGGFSTTEVILGSPVFFGLAHLHHFFNLRREVVRFAYTTLFGQYAAFILVRTGHVVAAVAVHAYCNFMGLPDLSFFTNRRDPLYQARYGVAGLYLFGLAAFCLGLFPITASAAETSILWNWPTAARA